MLKKRKWFFIAGIVAVAAIIAGIRYRDSLVSQKPFPRQESPEKIPDTGRGPENRAVKDAMREPPKPISEKDVEQPPLPGDLKIPDMAELEPKDITPQLDNYDAPRDLAFEQPAPPKADKISRPSSEGALPPQKGEPRPMMTENADQSGTVTGDLPPAIDLNERQSETQKTEQYSMPKSFKLKKSVVISLLVVTMAGMVAFVLKR